ncbi:MAG: amidohydrolase family protein [Candidatus Omnitrophica bacterium]|nr:amidohydrolase family protein [Candidatus Omnitrophota bacterium]
MKSDKISRRSTIKGLSAASSAALLGAMSGPWVNTSNAAASDFNEKLAARIAETPLIDTHEHLIEEEDRLAGKNSRIQANDWSFLFSHYINSDMITAGMPKDQYDAFFSAQTDPLQKWDCLESVWPAVRNTGYGQAVEIAVRELYNVDSISRENVQTIQDRYLQTIRPGFYRTVLQERANIESTQVNCLSAPFGETNQPGLLMQDISIVGMHMGPNIQAYAPKAGVEVNDLSDWHRVIDWWFDHYGPYAVAVKSQAAYSRQLDYDDVPAEEAEAPFKKRLQGESLSGAERKKIEDHLFWYSVRKATEHNLPVKLHTGYYAGQNGMPMSRIQGNPAAVTDLCKRSPETNFVFMHICYPFYEEMIAAAKHYTNCHIDMCWSWIISPVAGVNFLKQYLVTAPANKVLTFGGDYIPVEPVLGHAVIARRGIFNALIQLVGEGWLHPDAAMDLIEPIMNGNARRIFHLQEKTRRLQNVPWL